MNNYYYLEKFEDNILPDAKSKLLLWLDASDPNANGQKPNINTKLDYWVDKSPSKFDAVTNSPGNLIKHDNNDNTVLVLDKNIYYYIKFPDFPNKSSSIFIVLKNTGKSDYARAIHGPAESDNGIFVGTKGDNLASFTGSDEWNDVDENVPNVSNSNKWSIFTNVIDGDYLIPYVNGTPQINKLGSTKSFSDLLIGFYDDQSWIGSIAEIIIYNSPLVLEDRIAVEDYLSKKWKIDIIKITKDQELPRTPIDELKNQQVIDEYEYDPTPSTDEPNDSNKTVTDGSNKTVPDGSNTIVKRVRYVKKIKNKKRIKLEKFANIIYDKIIEGFFNQ
jgi:hypothetical protein